MTALRFALPAFAAISVTALLWPSLRGESHDRPIDAAWSAIGGCGAGGGGGSAGAGKWIGRGATGGLYDIQVLQNRTVGEDYTYDQTGIDLSTKIFETYTIGLSTSWKSNVFEIDPYKTGSDFTGTKTEVVGGFGDLGLSVSRNFGEMNQHSATTSLSLPTGRYDIKRTFSNADGFSPWMPPQVQPGSGHYSLGITGETTVDRDWGLYVLGANYTAAFARDAACGSSSDPKIRYKECQENAPSALSWRVWEIRHNQQYDYHGAPGTGATQSDAASIYAHVGYKEEAATQSAGITLSVPMAPTYWWEKGASGPFSTQRRSYDVSLKLSYGVELNLNPRNFPLFLSIGMPIVLNPLADGSLPSGPANWILTGGFKGTFL
jgi:hypothetical protein